MAGRGQRVAGRGTSYIQSHAPLTVPEEGNAQTHGVPRPGGPPGGNRQLGIGGGAGGKFKGLFPSEPRPLPVG